MKVTIEGTEYEIDLDKARELGLVTPAKRPIVFNDLKESDIFRCKHNWETDYGIDLFLMINPSQQARGQCVRLDGKRSTLEWFNKDTRTLFALSRNNTWITEI